MEKALRHSLMPRVIPEDGRPVIADSMMDAFSASLIDLSMRQ